jgi:hypothetical protein
MPMDPRLTALTTAARTGLKRRKQLQTQQPQPPVAPGVARPRPLTTAAMTPPAPVGQAATPATTTPGASTPASPAGSAPALGMLTEQLYKGTVKKRKRPGLTGQPGV